MANGDPYDKREEARRAMESAEHRVKREERLRALAQKRREAMSAMEGYEHKIKREQKEQEERLRILTQKMEDERRRKEAEAEELKKQKEIQAKLAEEEDQARRETEHLAEVKRTHEKIQQLKDRESDLSSLHTLKSDIAGAVKESKISLMQIALKKDNESILSGEQKQTQKQRRTILLVVLIVVLLLAGLVSLFLSKDQTSKKQIEPLTIIEKHHTTPILSEEHWVINLATATPQTIIKEIARIKNLTPKKTGIVADLAFTRDTATTEPLPTFIGLKDFLNTLGFELPNSLLRYLSNDFMLGVHKTNTGGEIFYILKVDNFAQTNALMLANENNILASLLMPLTNKPIGRDLAEKNFKDKIVKNMDTRALIGDNNKILVLYGFFDKNTLVIAESPEVFSRVVTALTIPQPSIQ